MKEVKTLASTKANADKMLREAYDMYYESVFKYCLVRTHYAKGSEEDSLQNTFLVYYKKLLTGEKIYNVKAFLYRTGENMCRQADTRFLRNAKRHVDISQVEDVPANEIQPFAAEPDYDALKTKLIQLLSDEEQTLFHLKYEQKKSLAQIAHILHITPNAAALRTSRLRKKIKSLIDTTLNNYEEGEIR